MYRCYARSESRYPNSYQFCGIEKGGTVYPVSQSKCEGSCPGKTPRPPYRIVDIRHIYNKRPRPTLKLLLLALIVLSTLFMV